MTLSARERERLLAVQRVLQLQVRCEETAAIERERHQGSPSLSLHGDGAEHLRDADLRRVEVYRKLVRATLRSAIEREIPLAAARLGDAYRDWADRFIAEQAPVSQVLRDVAYEFVIWVTPKWRADPSVADYIPDLARYELFEFDVHTAQDSVEAVQVLAGLPPDQGVAFHGSARVARFDHAVHQLPDDVTDRTLPVKRPSGALGYRDADGRYRQMDLTPLATEILLALLVDAQPLAAAVQGACAALGLQPTPKVVEGTASVLSDLAERGVILGGRSLDPAPRPPSPHCHWLARGGAKGRLSA